MLFDSYNILTWYLQDKLLGIGRSSEGLYRFCINHLSRQANPYFYHSVGKRIFTTYNLHPYLNILFECHSVISLSTMNPSHTSGSYILNRILYASIRQVQYHCHEIFGVIQMLQKFRKINQFIEFSYMINHLCHVGGRKTESERARKQWRKKKVKVNLRTNENYGWGAWVTRSNNVSFHGV